MMRIQAFFLLTCMSVFPLWGNPFSGDAAKKIPQLRQPSSQGPALETQRTLREKTADAFNDFAEHGSGSALALILGISFAYGVLHAAGPGHRKTVVFSLFLGKAARPWEPLAVGFMAAGLHAGAGIVVVGVGTLVYGAAAGSEQASAWLDISTFGILILMSLLLIILKLRAMIFRSTRKRLTERSFYTLIAVSSLVPCPAATMLLIFALYTGAPVLGIAAVIAMSFGMGLIISIAGYIAYFGRVGLFSALKTRERSMAYISDGLELLSYAAVALFALYMIWPSIVHT